MHGPFKPGDIVGIDHKGRQFLAFYEEEVDKFTVKVTPIEHNVTWFHIPKREVVTLWRFTRGKWATVKPRGGVELK